jgi:hypothetical protein
MQRTLNESGEKSNQWNEGRQPVSLDSPGVTGIVSSKLLYEINGYAITNYFEAHRWHLGASLIGHECSRYLWYVFRWCGHQVGSGENDEERHNNLGRVQRLFNRGHREESRYVEYLQGIGAEVWTTQPSGEQYRMAAVNGHYGGSLDGVCKLPARYGIDEPLLLEFKTNGTGKGFNDLDDLGLAVAKPQHFTQMSAYGFEYKLRYGLYMNTNKNDDDMYIEVVKLNWQQAEQFKAKAERIIISDEPPPRLAENPTYFKCVYCDMKKVCHEGALPERNCRSCKFAQPRSEGEWFCNAHNAIIPRHIVPEGCMTYTAIVNAA